METQIASTPYRPIDAKITLAPVLLCKRSALRTISGRERTGSGPRQRRKMYEEFENGKCGKFCIFKVSTPCKEMLKKLSVRARGLAQLFGFPTHPFSIFHRSMAPPQRIRLAKNTRCRNECSDFKKIDVEHRKRISDMTPNR